MEILNNRNIEIIWIGNDKVPKKMNILLQCCKKKNKLFLYDFDTTAKFMGIINKWF